MASTHVPTIEREIGAPQTPGEEEIHHPSLGKYWLTFGILMGLLFLTVGAYFVDLEKYIHFRGLNLIVALVIAVFKAAFVVLNFMNVKGGTKLIWLWAGLGFLWLFLLGGIFLDYQSRAWNEVPGWQ